VLSSHHAPANNPPESSAAVAQDKGKRKATSAPGTPPKSRKRFRKFNSEALRMRVTKISAFKATRLANEEVIRIFAGVRLAILEGMGRIEGMVWTHYDVSEVCAHYRDIARLCSQERTMVAYQEHFPSLYFRHPLLFDSEAARAHTLWSVLHHNCRYDLANLLFDVLTIRFRDEYALSHLLNVEVLTSRYAQARYWELLPYSEAAIAATACDMANVDSTSGSELSRTSDLSSLQYPDSEAVQSRSDYVCTGNSVGGDIDLCDSDGGTHSRDSICSESLPCTGDRNNGDHHHWNSNA
jgi:hypothetical protein